MMRRNFRFVITSLSLLASSGVLVAHHSFSSEYDGTKTFKVTGVVAKVEWTNPRVRFYVDVKEPDGKVANWNLELASPSALAPAPGDGRPLSA